MNQAQAVVIVAAELRLFLRPGRRSGPVAVAVDGTSSLGHVVESLGIPLTEAGRLLVNGEPATPGYRPRNGDVVTVEAVGGRSSWRRPVLFSMFTWARWRAVLRLAGLDAAYANDASDDALIEQANTGRRVLLTQDRGLLRRRVLWLGAYVRGARPDDQFRDVLDRFKPPLAPWTRCPACNGPLAPVAKAAVAPVLPPGTRRTYQTFSRCRSCGQVYWHGAHSKRLEQIIDLAVHAVSAGASG